MKIVIAGAGEVGFHLAKLLAFESHDITLIDTDGEVLQYAVNHLDVLGVKGDATSFEILQEANVGRADLFLAVGSAETTNLLAAILAKQQGAKRTVARVSNAEYMDLEEEVANFATLGVDHLISTRLLAALEIKRLLRRRTATDVYSFDDGLLSIMGFTADAGTPLIGRSYESLDFRTDDFTVRNISILRKGHTLSPHPTDPIQENDHIYLATNAADLDQLNQFIGKSSKPIRHVMIIGGTPLALQVAKVLESDYSLTVIVKEERHCRDFLEGLQDSLIVNADYSNLDYLEEEGLREMDAFVALTGNTETNIIACLSAKKAGVGKTIAHVYNTAYTHLSMEIGVDTIINKKILAANTIFKYIRKGKIQAIATFQGVDAEIIEYEIHRNNRVTNKPVSQLHLPKGARIVGVIRNKKGYIPEGDFQLKVEDEVIVFVPPTCVKAVEKVFK